MTAQPATLDLSATPVGSIRAQRRARRRRLRALILRATALLVVMQLAGAGTLAWRDSVRAQVTAAVDGHSFNVAGWMVSALRAKAAALWQDPAAGLTPEAGSQLVRAYLHDARRLSKLEEQAADLADATARPAQEQRVQLLAAAAALRTELAGRGPAAEAVLQEQIDAVLREEGFGALGRLWPPVLFTFTESPKQLVVSPRARIVSAFARTLDPNMDLAARERSEAAVEAGGGWSAYVTPTGGMGAFPTMVVPDASLEWVLSTVAHEWAHTYLAFFPLGFNYGITAENRIINETTADILGDEIGRRALERFYPELAPPPARDDVPPPPLHEGGFDFEAEMAQTRQVADQLLRFGRVREAEQYMELRRQIFVENGYRLRKLNQAWFAFHGSYGTGAAADISTPDAVAPKVVLLRARSDDLRTFIQRIRGITEPRGLDERLAESMSVSSTDVHR